MTALALRTRSAWENRFRTPTLDELLEPFNKQLTGLIEATREKLREFPDVTEEISWLGIPWRWSLVYRWKAQPERPWAYLVPEPGKPRLTLPMTTAIIAKLPARKLSRPTRDGIVQASEVAGVHWVQWELVNKPQLEELIGLAGIKHAMHAAEN